jgi:hypothetical protein
MQHPIMRALSAKGLSTHDAAIWLQVDPKTVERWCAGRIPYRANRAALARLTGWPEHDLWPGVVTVPDSISEGCVADLAYVSLTAISHVDWHGFFAQEKRQIDILHWALLAAEGVYLAEICRKIASGVSHRVMVGSPDRDYHHPADNIDAYVGINLRISRIPEYCAIYRADNQLLICPLIHGCPLARSPALQMSLDSGQGLAAYYLDIFQRSWDRALKV